MSHESPGRESAPGSFVSKVLLAAPRSSYPHPVNARSLSVISLLAGAMSLSPAFAAEPDYSGYAQLLSECRVPARMRSSEASENPAILTEFDYARLLGRDGFLRLAFISSQLLAATPSKMTRPERTAWAINTYNYLVIMKVKRHLDERGGKLASVRDVKDFFDAPVVEVETVRYSLDSFERHFLFADFDRSSSRPPRGLDPRVHFAIVCAARGCPPLAARPYRAATLDRDLDDITRLALGSRLHIRADGRAGGFAISSIFDWYAKDFGGRAGVAAFLGRHGPAPLRTALAERGPAALSGFIPWDWRLNQPGLPPAR